jgi:transposase
MVWRIGDCCATARPHTIPECRDQQAWRVWRQPLDFDQAIYVRRNAVELRINRLKQWHGVATRYEKPTVNSRAMAVIASISTWLQP